MKVREEINKYSTEEDKPILLELFSRYHWQSEWNFVAKCRFEKTGVYSYNLKRIWYPTEEGKILFNYFKNNP
jgi:hypothetical protein